MLKWMFNCICIVSRCEDDYLNLKRIDDIERALADAKLATMGLSLYYSYLSASKWGPGVWMVFQNTTVAMEP
jgi:hypothetical protein